MWYLFTIAAAAATLEVGQGQDLETVAAALAVAQAGDTLVLHPGYYPESITLTQRDVSITSAGGSAVTVLQPPAGMRGISISGGTVHVAGLTVEGGEAVRGGGLRIGEDAQVTLDDVAILGTSATWGGGVYVQQSSLSGTDLRIIEAQSTLSGAGLHSDSSVLDLTDLVIRDAYGERTWGSGISLLASELHLHGGEITGCHAQRQADGYGGGAIYADAGSSLALDGTLLLANSSYTGGAIALRGESVAVLVDVDLTDNVAISTGGAIDLSIASTLRCTRCAFQTNSAYDGGGVAASLNTVIELEDTVFTENHASHNGGGLYSELGTRLSLTRSSFLWNTAGTDGGAARVVASENTQITGGRFHGNSATRDGGAWSESSGKSVLTISRASFTENSTSGSGGALHVTNGQSLSQINCTLLGNRAEDGAAHLSLSATQATLVNNLFAWGAGGGPAVSSDAVNTVARSHLALWANAGGDWGPEWLSASPCTGCLGVDPQLVSWSADDDPTNDDLHPADTSPLIDAGLPSTSDPDGTVADIGAFWTRPPSPWDDQPIDPTWPDDPIDPLDPPVRDPNSGPTIELGPTLPPSAGESHGDFAGGGCLGQGQAMVLFAPLLFLLRRRRLGLLVLLPSAAMAGAPNASGVHLLGGLGEVQDYPNLVGTGAPPAGFSTGIAAEYAASPLTQRTEDGRVPLVRHLATGSVILSGSAFDALRFEAALPVAGAAQTLGGWVGGTGDLRLGLEAVPRPSTGDRLGVSVATNFWLPTGAEQHALAHQDPAVSFGVAVGQEGRRLGWTANLGARLAPVAEMRNLREGPGPQMGLGARWSPSPSTALTTELSVDGGHGWSQWPLTARVGARRIDDSGRWVGLGLGAGLNEAMGTSTWSAQVAWGYGSRRAPVPPTMSDVPDAPLAAPELVTVPPAVQPALAALVDNRIVLHENLFFREGRHELLSKSTPILEAIQEVLVDHEEIEYLLIQGHTNTNGTAAVNLVLSQQRAEEVLEWLVAHGIERKRLIAKGYGFEQPLVPHDHPDALRLNRRVEFLVVRPDEVPEDMRLPPEDLLPER